MKSEERQAARKLRQQGWSVGTIAKKIGCSKSSVSQWVRDIPLTPQQIHRLESNQASARAKAANHPNGPKHAWAKIRHEISSNASGEVASYCSDDVLKVVGSALYWAEGHKCGTSVVNFTNSDATMISLMMKFFRKICQVPEEKFRGALNIHPHLNTRKAERYWSNLTRIPLRQFHKTQTAVSRASQGKKDSLPLGTFRIVVCDVRLKSRINGWIEGMKGWGAGDFWANSSAG